MRIQFHGAAQTVTGSQHLITVNDKNILLDCGLYQGKRAEARERNQSFAFDPKKVDVLILSHAHIDHSGNIPSLVKQGFSGEIICTHATRDLCANMLLDSGHIQEKDALFFNEKIRKAHEDPIEPLYTQEDAIEALNYFYPIPYHKSREILPDVELTFLDAGHMLGSTIVSLQIQDKDSNREIRLVFSGDIGRKNLPIIRDPQTVEHADILIMESTYGDRLHPPAPETDKELAEIVNRTHQRGGALVIPSFAVGRTQQIVYVFQQLVAEGRIPKLPIYVDSPLAVNVTEAFRSHPEVYDKEIQDYMYTYHDDDPFGFDQLHYTRSVEDSKQLNTKEEPFVVISASGMCEAGRILHHLRNRVGDPRNTVLIVGWQAPETLGRRLVDGQKTVRIFGEEHIVRAEVIQMGSLSGHADADELVGWVQAIGKKPRQTFLVHGEPDPANTLKKRLEDEVGLEEVFVPELYQSVRL